ncbi:MAG: P-loop NTPase [Spirochaetales bacterium]|nr:P-loop NTPase [Spirochaetales bacterium]
MKILVCGKGGTGKSTLTALLAKEIAGRGNRVLVVDSDESNFGLGNLLGMDKPRDFMEYFGGKKVLFEKVKTLEAGLTTASLPGEYVSQKGNIRLISLGKIYDFGEGCACPINALAAKFLESLQLEPDELLVADTDAGVEHLGRGVERGCDVLLAVVEPSRESKELALRIAAMVKNLGKELYYVLNKIDDENEQAVMDSLPKDRVIASLPFDRRVARCGLEGSEPTFRLEGVARIAELLTTRRRR